MEYTYRVAGRTVTLQHEPGLVGVRYSEPAPTSKRAAFAHRAGADFSKRLEVPNEKFTVLPEAGEPGKVAKMAADAQPATEASVTRVSPVFRLGQVKVLATDRILVGLQDPNEPIQPLLKSLNIVDIKSRGYGEYTVQLAPDVDPLATAQHVADLPGVRYAEPDFVNIGPRLARSALPPAVMDVVAAKAGATEDEYLAKQYAMAITAARDAWKIQQGQREVRIAILDEGVDTRHEDLKDVVVAGYDAADGDEFQEPNAWDGHGTACAGLAAAVPNGKGIRGVAGGCSLMAVRIAYSDDPQGGWVTTNSGIAQAIDWSWRNGAHVLSNSWGGGAPSSAIVDAFERARSSGRDGKGCVIVVAAGNEAGPVSFPAVLDGVLAVSATNEYDEFKSRTSKDGEDWWGSNFGPEVDISAPGVHNYTTDISGAAGYNKTGNYYATFNGTSSATPIVAGAAALMLCANPALTESEVRKRLCATADKVGSIAYVKGHNQQFGFGRLNVLAAVKAAREA